MTDSVLARLKQAQKSNEPSINGDVADRMYSNLMSDIQTRAREDAKAEMTADVRRAEAERDSALLKQRLAEDQVAGLKAEISRLNSNSQEQARKLAMANQDSAQEIGNLKTKITEEQTKVQNLELQVSELKGKLSVKPQSMPAVVKSEPIPSFEFIPVRGPDGKISSVTAKPSRLN